jgi:hypothetical protein
MHPARAEAERNTRSVVEPNDTYIDRVLFSSGGILRAFLPAAY